MALVAIGAILALAVNVRLPFLNLRLTGLILLITGLAGLETPRRAYRWVRGHRHQLTGALDRFTEFTEPPPEEPRVPLDSLLQPGTRTGAQAGRHS